MQTCPPRNKVDREQTALSGMKMRFLRHTDGAPHYAFSAAGCTRDHFASAAEHRHEIISIAVYTRYAALNMPNAGESCRRSQASNGIPEECANHLDQQTGQHQMNAP